jgi:hypothetical protein
MEQRLALAPATRQIASHAMLLELGDVTPNGAPSLDLAQVIGMPPPGIVAAIPLKPAAWIIGMNPSFLPPKIEWLGCSHTEII